jgi:tetratricopeptide (TPR) repeat protein
VLHYINSGERIKQYRKMLNISQKEAAGNKLSHSMISLIESGKIGLTTVTAIILADNLNRIADEKGIDLNLSLKDMLMTKEEYLESTCFKELEEMKNGKYDEIKYAKLYEVVKANNLIYMQAEIREIMGRNAFDSCEYINAFNYFCDCLQINELIGNVEGIIRSSYLLGMCSVRLNNKLEAEKCFKRSVKYFLREDKHVDKYACNILKELIKLIIERQGYDEALQYMKGYLDNINREDADYYDILEVKGYILLKQKKYSQAFALYKELLDKPLENIRGIYVYISIAQEKLGLLDDAEASFKESLRLADNENVSIEELMGSANEYMDSVIFSRAVAYFEKVIEAAVKVNDDNKALEAYRSIYKAFELWGKTLEFNKYVEDILQCVNRSQDNNNKLKSLILMLKFYLETKDYDKMERLIVSVDKSLA